MQQDLGPLEGPNVADGGGLLGVGVGAEGVRKQAQRSQVSNKRTLVRVTALTTPLTSCPSESPEHEPRPTKLLALSQRSTVCKQRPAGKKRR